MDKIITTSFEESNNEIFFFDEADINKIGKIKFKGCTESKKNQIIMITYLAEIAYDIAISARDNVSDSPGFETCLGIFLNTNNKNLNLHSYNFIFVSELFLHSSHSFK